MLRVTKCVQVDNETMMVGFESGFTRFFKKETFLETVKSEPFYEANEMTILLGYACCTGLLFN